MRKLTAGLGRRIATSRKALMEKMEAAVNRQKTSEVVNAFIQEYPALPKLSVWLRCTRSHPDFVRPADLEQIVFEKLRRGENHKYLNGPAILALLDLFSHRLFKDPKNLYALSAFCVTQGYELLGEQTQQIIAAFQKVDPKYRISLKAETVLSYSGKHSDFLRNFGVQNMEWKFRRKADRGFLFRDREERLEIEPIYYHDHDIKGTRDVVQNLLQMRNRYAGFIVERPPFGNGPESDLPETQTLTPANLTEYSEYLVRNGYEFDSKHQLAMLDKSGLIDHPSTIVSFITLGDKFEIDFVGPTHAQIFRKRLFPEKFGAFSERLWEGLIRTNALLVERSDQRGLSTKKDAGRMSKKEAVDVQENRFKTVHYARSWTKCTDLDEDLFGPYYQCFVHNLHSVIQRYREQGKRGRVLLFLNGRRQLQFTQALFNGFSTNWTGLPETEHLIDEAGKASYARLDQLLNSLDIDFEQSIMPPESK